MLQSSRVLVRITKWPRKWFSRKQGKWGDDSNCERLTSFISAISGLRIWRIYWYFLPWSCVYKLMDVLASYPIGKCSVIYIVYRQTSNISCTLVGNENVGHSHIACWRCSKYIFILDLTPGFNGLGKDNFKTRGETFKFWDLVRLISADWRYTYISYIYIYICCITSLLLSFINMGKLYFIFF